jgi:ABC-2 type transport system ATP-binding protein
MSVALEVRGLRRSFGARTAVDDLDLTVQAGDVYGLLGPNGAGKTTAMRCILGLIRRDAGSVRVFGEEDPVAQRQQVGALVEIPRFHDWLSGEENLRIVQAYGGVSGTGAEAQRREALERVGLADRGGDPAGTYSQGMRQRLGIARALMTGPRLLMLDEPTNGLDPQGMRDVRELIRRLAGEGVTILVSSHLLGEVEAIATRVGILQHGKKLAEGLVTELLGGQEVEIDTAQLDAAVAAVEALDWARVVSTGPRLRIALTDHGPAELNAALVQAGVPVHGLAPGQGSLEDLFLQVTGGLS